MIANDGAGTLSIQSVTLSGSGASAFSLDAADAGPFVLAPGEARPIAIGFTPTTVGMSAATLRFETDDPMGGDPTVAISGTATRFTFAQVDRMGIPGLNTVFNHASGVGPFNKRAYNTASPVNDVAAYRGQFIIVLNAVGNPNSGATADLLLPDELPVNMGAATAFGALTGRALTDDAVDVALSVTVGIPTLQSDNVPMNDKGFLAQFPYLATPH
jgi:hypothetical protein